MLRVGDVRVSNSTKNGRGPRPTQSMAEYRVRDKQLLLQYIIPLFDQNRLLTSKEYNYKLFKKALLVATDSALTTIQKHSMLAELKYEVRPADYKSSA